LNTNTAQTVYEIKEEDQLRADMYSFLANMIRTEPSQELLDSVKKLTGDDSSIGKSIKLISKLASTMHISEIQDEYVNLFVGVGRGELLPFASYYLTGFLNDKPLSKLRNNMNELGVVRIKEVKEPEDHVSSLFDIMSGMITGQFGKQYSITEQSNFFEKHLNSWIHLLMSDIESAKTAVFYAPIGSLGKEFINIEREAFRMNVSG
jgi:TorA maturation chaperone TorD